MDFYRKILIFLIFCITLYLLYRLIISRIKHTMVYEAARSAPSKEGFANPSANYSNTYVKSIASNNTTELKIASFPIQNMPRKNRIFLQEPLKLKQFFIKSSYCSAYSGKDCSTEMILYVLSRGCRFLDLEIYYVNGELVVSYSNDYLLPAVNGLPLGVVLSIINDNAFGSMCPNKDDPLFIQFRVKYVPDETHKDVLNTTLTQIYNMLGDSIEINLTKLYNGSTVNSNTLISALFGKIVTIMDTSNYNISFANLSNKLKTKIHMKTNSAAMTKMNYSDIEKLKKYTLETQSDGVTTNATILQEITPSIVNEGFEETMSENYNAISMLTDYSFNICPMQFWNNGPQLYLYENIFNKGQAGILNMSDAIHYGFQMVLNPSIRFP